MRKEYYTDPDQRKVLARFAEIAKAHPELPVTMLVDVPTSECEGFLCEGIAAACGVRMVLRNAYMVSHADGKTAWCTVEYNPGSADADAQEAEIMHILREIHVNRRRGAVDLPEAIPDAELLKWGETLDWKDEVFLLTRL